MNFNHLNKCSCKRCGASANDHNFVNGAGWLCKKCGEANFFDQSVALVAPAKISVVFEDSTTVIESTCIDCGWKGSETEHHFLDGWHVCPSCHKAEFLVSGDELDEMNELEGVLF